MRRAAQFVASIAAAAGALVGASTPATAASLRVSPVLIDLAEGQRASSLTLSNVDAGALNVQVRVFRWTQSAGREQLEPTGDVVVSPPATSLAAGARHLVRVVRTSASPPVGEESYRVLVDEIPNAVTPRSNGVAFVMRQSLPVFFNASRTGRSSVSFSLVHDGQGWALAARNAGARRMRISDLELKSAAGATIHRRPGLLGYVLAGAEMRWPLPDFGPPGGAARLTAVTDTGPFDVDLGSPPR